MIVTQFSKQNLRKYQEDASFYRHFKNGDVLLGVFDGHGDDQVSEFVNLTTPYIFSSLSREIKKNPPVAFKELFERLVKKTSHFLSGSTASIVLIRDNVATIGVLGDSPVIIRTALGDIWKAPEHNVRSNIKERIAAEQRGALIIPKGYLCDKFTFPPYREFLQLSRVLGDKNLDRVLSREPEIFQVPLDSHSWIMVCSDGVIDPGHTSDAVLQLLINEIEHDPKFDAEQIVNFASQYEQMDNATVVLARP